MFKDLFSFYRSDEWSKFRQTVIAERTHEDGLVYDEITGKPIVKAYDMILHHKTELTEENVHDYNISLNPELIQIVSHKTHNYLHNKLGYAQRQVYLVYGAPMSGKTTFVRENMEIGDLIIDIDSIWECVSGQPRYIKPARLKSIVFRQRTPQDAAEQFPAAMFHHQQMIQRSIAPQRTRHLVRHLRKSPCPQF